jgi:hypothetical protein
MSDKTLIQGARELAASKATSGIGAAAAAGFIGVQERTAAKNAAINEQGRKEAEAIKARSAKNMSGWKGLGDLDQGIFPEAQQKEIRKTVFGIKDKFSKVATALAHDPTNLDLMEERDGYLTEMVSYKDSLDKVINFRRDYKQNVKGYSNSGANVPALAQNERFFNPDNVLKWDTQAGLNLPGEDGSDPSRFRDLTLPFSLPEDSFQYVSKFAGELSVPRKYEWNEGQIEAKRAEMQDYMGAVDPNTGVNNAPAILADDRFRSFFPEFEDIVYTEENHKDIAKEMTNIVMSRYKFIASSATEKGNPGAASNVVKPNLVATVSEMQAFEKEILTNQFTGPRETRSWSLGGSNNPEQLKIKYDPGTNKWTYLNAKKVSERRVADSLSELMTELPRLFYK